MNDPRAHPNCNAWLSDGDGPVRDLWLDTCRRLNEKDRTIKMLHMKVMKLRYELNRQVPKEK